MFRIALYDDDVDDLHILEAIILQYHHVNTDVQLSLKTVSSGEELLDGFAATYVLCCQGYLW